MPQYVYDIYNVVFIITIILFAVGLPLLLMSQGESTKMVGYSLTISFVEVCAVGLTYFFARGAAYLTINSNEWVLIAIVIAIIMVVGNAALVIFMRNNNPGSAFGVGSILGRNPNVARQQGQQFMQQGFVQQRFPQMQTPQTQYGYAPPPQQPQFSQQQQAQYVRVAPVNPYGAGGSNPYKNYGARFSMRRFPSQPQF